MAAIDDFIAEINGWTNVNTSDTVVKSWVRMAEERIDQEVRCQEQIRREVALFAVPSQLLPEDWLEFEYLRDTAQYPYDYVTNNEFFARQNPQHEYYHRASYTVIGNEVFIHPAPNPDVGIEIEIAYYYKIPPLADGPNWAWNRQKTLLTFTTLVWSAPYLVEDARIQTWNAIADRTIQLINDNWQKAKSSGSPIVMRKKGFG